MMLVIVKDESFVIYSKSLFNHNSDISEGVLEQLHGEQNDLGLVPKKCFSLLCGREKIEKLLI